jgi:Creatinase/Prolidase N-terminal domain
MSNPTFDYPSRWHRAATLMERDGIDALFLMKPANLAYLTGDQPAVAAGSPISRQVSRGTDVPVRIFLIPFFQARGMCDP